MKIKKKEERVKIKGNISLHKKGFAFVRPAEEYENIIDRDIFIKKENIMMAMENDKVLVEIQHMGDETSSPEGKVVKVMERNKDVFVCQIDKQNRYAFGVPVDKKIKEDIFISSKYLNGAKNGDIAMVKIINFKSTTKKSEGKVVSIISNSNNYFKDIDGLIVESGRHLSFSKQVEKNAKKISKLKIKKDNRVDLRDEVIFTIDGKDSKDFDDAVSIKRDGENFILGVHIADVAHYVKDSDILDKEAFKRANSVYLLDRVVPMLPKSLSNGICSLVEGEDRLTMTCQMTFDKKGKCLDYDIFESIINSKKRFTYDEVNEILKDIKEYPNIDDKILDSLSDMKILAEIFIENRRKRGSIDFDTKEPQFVIDEKGRVTNIYIAERNFAHRLIEEFMLKANEMVSEKALWLETPFVYRNHEKPKLEKIEDIQAFLKGFGLKLRGDLREIKPYQISNILEEVKGKKIEDILNRAMLKSMEKAEYDIICQGHFGLALNKYAHFTSPIRRYADLQVHRILKYIIKKDTKNLYSNGTIKKCQKVAERCSEIEKTTLELERDVEDMMIAKYMSKNVGREFDGIISGVTNHGIYVEIKGCIDGRVSLMSMRDDYYELVKEKFQVVGKNSNKVYSLGDKVRIRVQRADEKTRELDFILI